MAIESMNVQKVEELLETFVDPAERAKAMEEVPDASEEELENILWDSTGWECWESRVDVAELMHVPDLGYVFVSTPEMPYAGSEETFMLFTVYNLPTLASESSLFIKEGYYSSYQGVGSWDGSFYRVRSKQVTINSYERI